MNKRKYLVLAAVILQSFFISINAQPLKNGFVNPPESARPWVMWFWSNGNITKTGITADLEAMKRVGIGGVTIFEVLQGVPIGTCAFGSPEWREMFKFVLQEANRLGIKVNMNNDAGWAGSGGPWIPVEKSMQTIVSTETIVQGSKELKLILPKPETTDNYYEDLMVLAFPTPEGDDLSVSDYNPEVKSSSKDVSFDGKKLMDNDEKTQILLPKPTTVNPQYIEFVFPKPFTSHFMTILLGARNYSLNGSLQVSDDGIHYKTIKEFKGVAPIQIVQGWKADPPSITLEYSEQSSRWYRLTFNAVSKELPEMKKVSIAEVKFSNSRLNYIEPKAMFAPTNYTLPMHAEFPSIASKYTVQSNQVLNITDKMKSDGAISWNVPQGKWTILRIGHTTTGIKNKPSPKSGQGYECDKLSKEASTMHFNGLITKLTEDSKGLVGKSFVSTHIDSWEMGNQNWTPGFYQEFEKRRGYSPTPYLPVMNGIIVNNIEMSERFLWDFRTTISELMLENYAGNMADLAHQNGLKLSIEAYRRCMTDEMTYAGRADEPTTEFWAWGIGDNNFDFASTEMTSAAHVYGKKIVAAEAFTSGNNEKWLSHPGNIKELGDWAFSEGVNKFVFHRYAMQPYENIKPGLSMGPWGLHYERTQTWWEQSVAWHQYLSRCQYLLQQGLYVADICQIAPELTPQTWRSPYKRDSVKYKFDGCPAEVVLTRMSVKNGLIMLPDGMNYKLLVMPATETMTPKLLRKIKELIEAGATVVGAPPRKASGLSNYPHSDEEIQKLVAELLGKCDGVTVKENRVGKGRVIMGKTPEEVMAEMKIERDFTSKEFLRFIHRNIDGTEVYFVANPTKNAVNTTCQFRVQGMQPQLWNPMNGKTEKVAQYEELNGTIKMPISLAAEGSVFVVFQPENKTNIAVKNIVLNGEEQNI
ncbi:MAG: glycosyl hydrolase, partial [Paludibacter sp.]